MSVEFLYYMAVLSGRLTDEKEAYIGNEKRAIRDIQAHDRDAVIGEFVSGEITAEKFNRRLQRICRDQRPIRACKRAFRFRARDFGHAAVCVLCA